jgi:ABC-type Fe3+ transport system substrate-binding protein
MLRLRVGGIIAALFLGLALAQAATAETVDQIYAKAKAEKTLVFYAGGPTLPWETAARVFQEKYPGIEVKITGGFSNVLDQKIDQQLKDKKLETDMAFFQTVQDFVRWKKAGVLLAFKPDGWSKIDPGFKDEGGAFVGVSVNGHPYAYNTQKLAAEDVPKSALDFLKPQFKGKLITCYPQDDDATLYVFDSITKKYGWKYWDRYMANQPNFVQGHLSVARSISAGDNIATFDAIANTDLSEKYSGKPQDIAFSTVDPLPVWPLTAGIFKDAPHPNAAKLFLSWYLSKEQQGRTGTWSVRSDVPPPPGLKPLSAMRLVNSYRAFLTDEKRLVALRERFAKLVGPIKNAGGVR